MQIEYVLSATNRDHKYAKPIRVLITRIIELKKLLKNRFEVQNNVGTNQWNRFVWNQHKNTKKFQFGNYVLWYFKGEKTHLGKFKKRWFGPFRV
jgi:hypothetical protein